MHKALGSVPSYVGRPSAGAAYNSSTQEEVEAGGSKVQCHSHLKPGKATGGPEWSDPREDGPGVLFTDGNLVCRFDLMLEE